MARLLTIPAKTITVLLVSLLMVGTIPTPAFAEATSLLVDQVSAPYRSTTSLTATVTPNVGGLSVDFSLGGSSVGSAQTNSNGVATLQDVALGTRAVNTYADAISATLPAQDIYETSGDTANLVVTTRSVTGTFTADSREYNGLLGTDVLTRGLTNTGGGAVTLSGGTASFGSKGVGTNKTVTLSGATLAGADADNYVLDSVESTTADITARDLTVTATAQDKQYDGDAIATVTLDSNKVSGDTVNLTYTSASFANKEIGTDKTVTVSGIAIGAGGDGANYDLQNTSDTDTADITAPNALTVSFTASNKPYDRTTTATYPANSVQLGGVANGDDVGLDLSGATASFASATVGVRQVTLSGYSLTGPDAGKYSVVSEATDTATITPKPLTVSFTSANRTYDTTTAAAVSARVLAGVISPDDVSVTGGSATFNTRNVGLNKTVTGSGFSLSGDAAGNYSIGTVNTTTASIGAAPVTGAFTAGDKVYDGLLTAQITGRDITGGVLGGETVTLAGGTAAFATKDVGVDKSVTGSGFTAGGADGGNYFVESVVGETATITERPVTGSFTVEDREYDGTTVATVASTALANAIGADDVLLVVTGATFATAGVGTNKPITPGAVALSGADAGNYSLGTVSNTNADITQKLLTVAIPSPPTKRYDGSADATDVVALEFVGVVGSDDAFPTHTNAVFASPEVGPRQVTVSGIDIGGTAAGSYRLASSTATVGGEILPKNGVFVDFTAQDKIYNGRRGARFAAPYEIVGPTAADAANVDIDWSSLTFNTRLAGRSRTVTLNGLKLTGTAAHRYVLATLPPTDRAAINRRLLSVRAIGHDKVWDGTTAARVTLYARNEIAADTLRLRYDKAEFGGPAVGQDKPIYVTGITVGGTDAANYRWNSRTRTKADIIKLVKRYRADGLIKLAGRRFIGNNTYNTTADRQTKELNARRGQKRVFYVKVQNDRVRNARSQPLRLEGCFPTRGFKVNYFRGRTNTQIGDYAMVDGDLTWVYRTPRLRPGRGFLVRMVLRPTSFAKIGSQSGCAITTISTRVGTERRTPTVDMVRARLTVIRRR